MVPKTDLSGYIIDIVSVRKVSPRFRLLPPKIYIGRGVHRRQYFPCAGIFDKFTGNETLRNHTIGYAGEGGIGAILF
jgi:hypothetical protein